MSADAAAPGEQGKHHTPRPGAFTAWFTNLITLKFWYGMELSALTGLFVRNRFKIDLKYIPVVLLAIYLSAVNSILTVICRFVFSRRIRATKLEHPPVFVLGHWRSGTTYLHELLGCDPSTATPNGYQCFLPGHFLLSESSLKPVLQFLLPNNRPMDMMSLSLDKPQEDEFALLNLLGRSNYAYFVFPRDGASDPDYVSLRHVAKPDRDKWLGNWSHFLKSVNLRAGLDNRLLLKSPQHTARIAAILELFPQAKFVHISRNPLSIYASTLRTWRLMIEANGLQDPRATGTQMEESVLDTLDDMYRCYEEDRRLIPTGNLCEVSYEALVAAPKPELRKIYDTLDLGDFGSVEAAVDARLAEARSYMAQTSYNQPQLRELIAKRWKRYIDLFGYDLSAKDERARE